jgi:hypothetical protein
MASIFLDRIDAAPVLGNQFEYPFATWLAVLVNVLNENIQDIQDAFNFLTTPNFALLSESVTLTSGSPSFTVADGTIYRVGNDVIGSGIPDGTKILSIVVNTITLTANATTTGASTLTFVPTDVTLTNGILLYDTTNNVYVGMQNGALVKFTTSAYP